MDVRIERVGVERILPVRHRVLRPGQPLASASFEGDNDPATVHLAAMDRDGRVVGCATLMCHPFPAGADADTREIRDGVETRPGGAAADFQLRGMAVDDACRGTGVGRRLLETAEEHVRTTAPPAAILWCNARTSAVPFYRRLGWRVVSKEFHLPTAGPHHRMVRTL